MVNDGGRGDLMDRIKGKAVIFLIILSGVFLVGAVIYLIRMPVPIAVGNQIDEDLYHRAITLVKVYGFFEGQEQILSFQPDLDSFKIEEVIHIDSNSKGTDLPITDGAAKALCVSVLVTYDLRPKAYLLPNQANPEIYNYLAEKVDGAWSILFLDNRVGTCG